MLAAATTGFWDWSFDPLVLLIVAVALVYWLDDRRTVTPRSAVAATRWRRSCFYAGLAVLTVALYSPLEELSRQLFWAHMIQHVLLLLVAPPLIVLARPWVRLWRTLPLQTRRGIARPLSRGREMAPLRWTARALGAPAVSFVAFSGVLVAWHIPALFDATLRSNALHALEHTLFFWTALLFWKQVIPSPPLRTALTEAQRVLYCVGAMIVSWGLAVVLALAPHPLYEPYAHEATRPGGISALADQQLAAGIMWVPGSVTLLIVIFYYIHRWLVPDMSRAQPDRRLAGEH